MAASDEPQGATAPGDIPIEEVRDFLREMVGRRSLRQIAEEAGIGREAVRKFVSGYSMPHGGTARKLRELYVQNRSEPMEPVAAAPEMIPGLAGALENEILRIRLASARRAFASDAELAEVLGVDRAQPSRWRAGQIPDPLNRERIVAIDVVVELLSTWLSPTSIPKWLKGVNAHLGNRRPIAVLKDGGLSEVLAAIEAEKAGAYA
ncbi:MAG TPA: helix-turn-helix transcriptional regulator [Longimicrobium sp.]|jgi:hypothetical protein